jgi:murein DD-endopeptidase MepM/ murein hydrolase activator NlpD
MRRAIAIVLGAWLSACAAEDPASAGAGASGGSSGAAGSAGAPATGGAAASDSGSGGVGGSAGSSADGGPGAPIDGGEVVVWPLSASAAPDADEIRAQYGPRYIGKYDFHAGIDIAAPKGTPVHAVLAGKVVNVVPWDGAATAGNNVLVEHSGSRFTAYLHLDAIGVAAGDWLAAGDVLGSVGDTGATYDHLHFTYMIDLKTPKNDERKSRNPLELLPHGPVPAPSASFVGGKVDVTLAIQHMSVEHVTLQNGASSRSVSYYDVVALGSVARDAHAQSGIYLDAGKGEAGAFPLLLGVDPPDFLPTRVVLRDFFGAVLLDASQ